MIEEDEIIGELKKLCDEPETPKAPPVAKIELPQAPNVAACRDICYRCEKRDRRACGIDGISCVQHADENNCPLGKYKTGPTPLPQIAPKGFVSPSLKPLPFYIQDGAPIYLQGLYRGRSAFLICGGPSFGKVDQTKLKQPGIITMGVNNSVKSFRPNLWVHGDVPDNFIRSIWTDPTITKFTPLNMKSHRIFNSDEWSWTEERTKDCPGVFYYKLGHGFKPETFLSGDHAVWGNQGNAGGVRTTFLAALRILFELGFRKVYLLGVDFEMGKTSHYHFDQGRTPSSVNSNNHYYKVTEERCQQLVPHFKSAGFQVFNCNPNSKLKAFPFIDYNQAIDMARDEFGQIDVMKERTAGLYDQVKPDQNAPVRELKPAKSYLTPTTHISALRYDLPEDSAFNGATVETDQGRLLVYRTGNARSSIASVFLDQESKVVPGSHRVLNFYRNDDPRLVKLKGEIYLVTSYHGDGYKNEKVELRKLILGAGFVAGTEDITKFDTITGDPHYVKVREKNWIPFVHEDSLYFVHWVNPHRILKYNPESKQVGLVNSTDFTIPAECAWLKNDELRLNTNPVRLQDGNFLSVVHVWNKHQGYFNGFYLFEGQAPFRVLKISKTPHTVPGDATSYNPRNGRHGCIFLQTLEVNEETGAVRVYGGNNDHATIALDFKLSDILDNLVAVDRGTDA